MIILKNKKLSMTLSEIGASVMDLCIGEMHVAERGMIAGRYANRIAKGIFQIGGKDYHVTVNDGENHLHGGRMGFGVSVWTPVSQNETEAVLRFVSPDGDEGFPGELTLDVKYTLLENGFSVDYSAVCTRDCPVNFTNHSYFNLNGGGSVRQHSLWLNADCYTPVDAALIPTGEIAPVAGTKYDFRIPRKFEADLDNNFCLNAEGYAKAATLRGSLSELTMDVYTSEPGLQVYNTADRICLETQHYPDSPNHANFPETLLKAGECYTSKTAYLFYKSPYPDGGNG